MLLCAEPMGLYIDTYGTSKVDLSDGEIANKLSKIFDMRPFSIENRFNLRTPIYSETASYGHMVENVQVLIKLLKMLLAKLSTLQ